MKKVWAFAIAFLLVGVLVGFGGGFWYRQGDVDTSFAAGMAYQESITPVAITPASLLCSFTTGTEILGDPAPAAGKGVEADGGVSILGYDTDTLTIENTDEERTATDLTILLYNPITDKEGLHDNLEVDALEITVTIGSVTSSLYHDGVYSTGIVLGDLGAAGTITVAVNWTAGTCVAGTFQPDQTYSCGIYIYQPDANYVDTVSYTITT